MAKIVASKNAPDADFTVTYGVGQVAISGKSRSVTSDDRALLAEAANHPWLAVEWDKVEMLGGEVIPPSVDPKKDPLSAQNPDSALVNDPDAVRAAQEAARVDTTVGPAIEPTLDQDKVIVEGGVDKTLAADEKTTTTTEKASK